MARSGPKWMRIVLIALAGAIGAYALYWFLGTEDSNAVDNGDPVTRARAAGWYVDPRIEESMRRLPPQSALYDVTGKPPSEVRYVGPDDPNMTIEVVPPGELSGDDDDSRETDR